MLHGFRRIPRRTLYAKAGWGLLLPVCPWWRRGYLILHDAYATGWWWFSIGFSIAPVGAYGLYGVNFRLTWGWVTSAPPDEDYGFLRRPL